MTPTTDHGWIYEALERLCTDMQQQHVRLRDDMNRGFDALRMEIRHESGSGRLGWSVGSTAAITDVPLDRQGRASRRVPTRPSTG